MVYFCADDDGISKSYNKRIEECLEKGIKSKALKRALEVDIPEEIYENLRERINK